jgi:hypothetical protein
MKKKVLLAAPIQSLSGYGARSRDLLTALLSNDSFDVYCIPIKWGNLNTINFRDVPNGQDLFQAAKKPIPSEVDVYIQCTIAKEFGVLKDVSAKLKIGITAGIETTEPPQDWVEGCNRMDVVLFSSQCSRDAFVNYSKEVQTKEGVQTLKLKDELVTDVLIEGLDVEWFDSNAPSSEVKRLLSDIPDFSMLFVGTWLPGGLGFDRKNIANVIKLYIESVKGVTHEKVGLILKTSMGKSNEIEKDTIRNTIRYIMEGSGVAIEQIDIRVIHGDMTDSEIVALYSHKSIKAMISLSHGEGWCRPLAEFGLTGKPIIAPNWGGQCEYLDVDNSFLVDGDLSDVARESVNVHIIEGSRWWYPKRDSAVNQIQSPIFAYDEALIRAGKLREKLVANYKLSDMANKLSSVILNS